MSRSFKKTPGWCDSNKYMKRYANKRLRKRNKTIDNQSLDGGLYKKYTCSYIICDYKFLLFTKEDFSFWIDDSSLYKVYMK